MDLQLSAEQVQLRDATRRLLADRLAVLVARLPEPPVHDADRWVRDAQNLGWLGLALPELYGGAGGFEDLVLVHEELGRGLAPSLLTTLALSGRLLVRLEPGPARDELLTSVLTGSLLIAPAVDFGGPPGVTVMETEDGLRLDGRHAGVVDAAAAVELLVAADSGDAVTLVRVPVDADGLALVAHDTGCDVPSYSATFDGVVVARAGQVAVDAGPVIHAVRTEAAILAAARALGGGRAVLERTVEHVRTRHQFGVAIGTFQAVQHQLADIATALDAAGLVVARAAWAVEVGLAAKQVDAAAGTAALAATEAFAAATLVAHQLHGGMGFVLDSPLHLWSARAVSDPTAPRAGRDLLDALATSLGLTADDVRVAPQHRLPA
jgi:alkylation response protein AidB-like acyl-CoA dehydrogenase